jgi:two-component system response regulator (stage 0 sporulation protein F)
MTRTKPSLDHVLIVDDDYDIREMLTVMLRRNGYRALSAVDREEALTVLAENSVHTILLDYMMPGTSATKFLDIVTECYPETKVILITAGDRVDAVAETLGLHRFIGKPFDEGKLLNMVSSTDSSLFL